MDLHGKIFAYCETKKISREDYLKIVQFKKDRNSNSHINLPSVLNKDHLRQRLMGIKTDIQSDSAEMNKYFDFHLVANIIDGIIDD